jgi:hypothetical protein
MNKLSMPQPVSVTGPIHWVLAAAPQREGKKGNITLIAGHRGYTHQRMHALIVELALEGPVRVLIGGNRYDHYRINYALAAATPLYEYILAHHLHLSRAETCYQMVELLTQTQAGPAPCLILDLLTTFYDEGIPEREIDQLLFETILQLRRLSRGATVTVSAHAEEKRPQLLKVIENAADLVERPPAPSFQPLRQPILIG